jgi:hypothetical protein
VFWWFCYFSRSFPFLSVRNRLEGFDFSSYALKTFFFRIKTKQFITELDIFLVFSLLDCTVWVIKASMKVSVIREILFLKSHKNHNVTCYLMCCWGVRNAKSFMLRLIWKDCDRADKFNIFLLLAIKTLNCISVYCVYGAR